MTKLTDVDLVTICRGAAPEVFAHEFRKVLANVQDLNTDPTEVRTITMKFKFKPLDSREEAQVRMEIQTKLAAVAPVGGHMFMGRSDGQFRATTHDTQQEALDLRDSGKVTSIDRASST